MNKFRNVCAIVILAVTTGNAALAADAPPKPQPTTVADPNIPPEQLQIMLVPLTKDELIVEADGWLGLVRAKAREISQSELASKGKKKEIEDIAKKSAEKPADAPAVADGDAPAAEAATAAKTEDRSKLLADINKLRDERTVLIDRTRIVLAELKQKGGKPDDYEIYLTAVSGITLDTKDAGAAWAFLEGWIRSEQGGVRWGINIIKFLVTLIVFRFIGAIVAGAVRRAMSFSKSVSSLLRDFLVNSVRKVVFFIGLVVALSMLEVNIGPFLAAIGAFGFVVGFALQGTMSNFASGVMILLYRPYDLGSTVTVGGVTGKVDSMSLVSTTVKTDDGKTAVIPNNAIWGSAIHTHASK